MITSEKINQFGKRIETLGKYLNIEKRRLDLTNEEERTGNPDFWNDSKAAEIVMRKIRETKYWIDGHELLIAQLGKWSCLWSFTRKVNLRKVM